MKKAVAAQAGEAIQIRRGSGLKRGPVAQYLVGSIAKAIKEYEDDLHQEPRFLDSVALSPTNMASCLNHGM
jgi:hypothetical protein